MTATYGYGFADRQETLVVDDGVNPTQSVVTSATYKPSGPLTALALGNGLAETRGFDQRYFPASIDLSGVRTWTYTVDDVGNVTQIDETAGCTPTVAVDNQTLTLGLFEACMNVTSANTTIDPPGPVTFRAGETVRLDDPFTVSDGAEFVAENDFRLAPFSFTYAYQDHQYFLTQGVGHWGTLDYTYDRIGNRLSEARTIDDGSGPVTMIDNYSYLQNGIPANTPILQSVALDAGSSRSYSYGLAGHLENVTAGANTIDFTTADDGRLVALDRLSGTNTSAFTYDGRSFLSGVETPVGVETATTEPTYSSEGLLHALLRQESSTAPQERFSYLYFAGRPAAQLRQDGATTEWTFLTADHLGTPFIATDLAGDETWLGPFEPFGRDPLQGTAEGARDSGIFVRFPGQWDDGRWQDASSGADLYYNVHRWYEYGGGRYTRADPVAPDGAVTPFTYARANPLAVTDSIGLFPFPGLHPAACLARVFTRARVRGTGSGWRWAHCWASCEVTRQCGGAAVARAAGLAKEVFDALGCGLDAAVNVIGTGPRCESAFQPSDFRDNEFGIMCPPSLSCDARCEPLVGRSSPPGPLYGLGPIFPGLP